MKKKIKENIKSAMNYFNKIFPTFRGDKRIKKPWFQTINDHSKKGPRLYTQDLSFFEKFRTVGYKCAVDTRVRVGHLDFRSGQIY